MKLNNQTSNIKMEINIVSYSAGPCEINPRFKEISLETEIKIEAMPQIRFSRNSDVVGMQIDIEFFAKEDRVVKFGFLIGINISGWMQSFTKGENPTENRELIKSLCNHGWLVGTGILMSKSQEQIKHAIVLPSIDLESFVKDVRFVGSGANA